MFTRCPRPHLILEYSDHIHHDADFIHMLSRLHELMVETGGYNMIEGCERGWGR